MPQDQIPTTSVADRPGIPLRLRPVALALAAVLGLGAVGCEQAPAEGADDPDTRPPASVEAFIQDAPLDGGASAAGAEASATDAAAPEGSMVGNFIISVYSDEGYWVDLGREAEMTVPLRDATGARPFRVTTEVPEGVYSRVRVLLCHSSVDVAPGSRVGESTVEEGADIHITETGDVIIERNVEPFRIAPGERVRLDVDLNTPGWLTEEAVAAGRASVPTLEDEVEVAVRTDVTSS